MNICESLDYIEKQLIPFLKQLSSEDYSLKLTALQGASVGQHVRHILDFYSNLALAESLGMIDYHNRNRNSILETNKQVVIQTIISQFSKIKAMDEGLPLEVFTDFRSGDLQSRTPVKTSFAREAMYCFEHAIHHMAMIRIGVSVTFPQVKMDKNFGVAPSTLHFHQTQDT